MKHSKGIQGIRKLLATNATNWHVWIQFKSDTPELPRYQGFYGLPLNIVGERFEEYELTGFQGNGLFFKEI